MPAWARVTGISVGEFGCLYRVPVLGNHSDPIVIFVALEDSDVALVQVLASALALELAVMSVVYVGGVFSKCHLMLQ